MKEGDKKRKYFIERFLKIYYNIYWMTEEGEIENLEKKEEEIFKLLPKYSYLFEDINFLYEVYNGYFTKEKPDFFLKNNFKGFMKWVFDKLYSQKIVNREEFDELNRFLIKFNLNPTGIGYGAGASGLV